MQQRSERSGRYQNIVSSWRTFQSSYLSPLNTENGISLPSQTVKRWIAIWTLLLRLFSKLSLERLSYERQANKHRVSVRNLYSCFKSWLFSLSIKTFRFSGCVFSMMVLCFLVCFDTTLCVYLTSDGWVCVALCRNGIPLLHSLLPHCPPLLRI